MFEFIEELRCEWYKDKLLESPTVTIAQHPAMHPKKVPVGGFGSFVWPKQIEGLCYMFADAFKFQSTANKKWYTKRGIPFRRGYFLYGAPKCGKTHCIKLLARHLGASLHIIDLDDPMLTDGMLIDAVQGGQCASS